jgi:hypothetical protein
MSWSQNFVQTCRITALHLLACLVLAGCWTTTQPTGPINVRMDRPDDRLPKAKDGLYGLAFCKLDGEPAPELFDAIVSFARANLISKLDPFNRTPNTPIRTRLVGRDDDVKSPGIHITVTSRERHGELRVANWWRGGGGNSLVFCLHVRRERQATTVVIEELWDIISAR